MQLLQNYKVGFMCSTMYLHLQLPVKEIIDEAFFGCQVVCWLLLYQLKIYLVVFVKSLKSNELASCSVGNH